ncbi:LysR family transcriptional regulator [Pseudonocardia spinosispora]|uniref:LysR family transcriptional regulator n=1 Tax=Pseudonocardia spinosispora TaxID=103441 RepID=UPI0004173640|nr:LysR family transcriptional regulator [Pseudonocardia spinosispora]
MERRQLEYFLAVVAHGGFTNAARTLHVSQPSLSHAIASLEAELGGMLFHRLPHGVVLTPAGQALVGPARQVARDLVTATASVREVLGLSGGRLDIVAQTTLAVDPLAGMVGRFVSLYPKVGVRISDPDESGAEHMVRTGERELGLVKSTLPARELDGLELADQELRLVLPPVDVRCALPDVAPVASHRELTALSFVTTPEGTATRVLLEETVRALGSEPRIAVETAHRAMMVPLVLAGAGAALLPRSMAADAEAKGARVHLIEPALRYRGRLVWRSGPLSPAARTFVELAISDYSANPHAIPAVGGES